MLIRFLDKWYEMRYMWGMDRRARKGNQFIATTKYANQPVGFEIEIDPKAPHSGRLTVSLQDQGILEFHVPREVAERLYHQLGEQLKQAPLLPDHR
jgi:hypothetical protein